MVVLREEGRYISIKDLAKELGISYQTVYDWVRKGTIKSFQMSKNGKRFILKSDIEKLVKTTL